MQADAKTFVRAAEQRLQVLETKNAEILRDFVEYMNTTKTRHSQAEAEKQDLVAKHASWQAKYQAQHDSDVQSLQARHQSVILKLQAEHSFGIQTSRSQHKFAFESSETHHKSQLQATLAEHVAATLKTQSQHESEVKALKSQLESQAELVAQHSADCERSLSQQQAPHSDIVAQLQARHITEASQLRKRNAGAQAQHDSDMQALKAEHEVTITKVHAKAESAMSAHTKQLSPLQDSHAQHESHMHIAQAEHEASIHALETKHSDAIAKARTDLDSLTAQTAAAVDKALAQHEADVHALTAQREATACADKDKCGVVAELKLVRKLLEESEAGLAKSQKTHAATLLGRLTELQVLHRSELADLRAAQSYGQDTEGALAHLRAKHEEDMRTELELRDNKIHWARENQRKATHIAQNLRSQLTQAQSNMDHHVLKLTQEGKLMGTLPRSSLLTHASVAPFPLHQVSLSLTTRRNVVGVQQSDIVCTAALLRTVAAAFGVVT